MGFLNLFSKGGEAKLEKIPAGSFTVDRDGRIVISTMPQKFTEAYGADIAKMVLTAFRTSKEANLMLTEIFIHYAGLKITAKELRGGAMIFLAPRLLN